MLGRIHGAVLPKAPLTPNTAPRFDRRVSGSSEVVQREQIGTAQKVSGSERPPVGAMRIGLSGWSYRHWQPSFYPQGLPTSRQLEYLSAKFNSVEINRT